MQTLPTSPSRLLRINLLITDLGFVAYWSAAALALFPPEWLYANHDDPMMVSWNWSFAPMDLMASFLGLTALVLARRGNRAWSPYALVSSALTFCAGMMAIAFWTLQRDFNPAWWLPNLYLMLWPILTLRSLTRS